MRAVRWLGLAVTFWTIAIASYWAFRRPWRWDGNQILFVLCLTCLSIVILSWGVVWMRGGSHAVRERWAMVKNPAPVSPRFHRWSLAIWIVVALALVFIFNMYQHG